MKKAWNFHRCYLNIYWKILAMVASKIRIFSKEFCQNPRWRPSTRYGPANFFPMGDKFKILFSRIRFWGTGNAMKPFTTLCARYFHQIRRIWRFSAVFTYFYLIYHYFEAWNIIHATIVMFWVQRIKWRNIENCQTTRVARLRGISTAICYFSADFKHFPSIYKYFDFRQVILVAIPKNKKSYSDI